MAIHKARWGWRFYKEQFTLNFSWRWKHCPANCWPHWLCLCFSLANRYCRCYLTYFLVAVVKHRDQDNLEKKELIWAYGSRGMRVHDRQPGAEHQGAGMAAGAGSWGITSLSPDTNRKSKLEERPGYELSKPASTCTSSGRDALPRALHQLQLGTKCPNAWVDSKHWLQESYFHSVY